MSNSERGLQTVGLDQMEKQATGFRQVQASTLVPAIASSSRITFGERMGIIVIRITHTFQSNEMKGLFPSSRVH